MKHALTVVVCVAGLVATASGAEPSIELRDGDRVVLIGDALIERDQEYGYLETILTLQNPDRSITFRNLGWSGDTVFGDARARFGTQADGFNHLREHILALKPTVVVVGYGMSDSFAGEAGLPRFVSGLNTLLDVIAETRARVILLSPIYHEDLGRPLPDPTPHNRSIRLYRDAIKKAADERDAEFLDLFNYREGHTEVARNPSGGFLSTVSHLTDDGIHLTEVGYWVAAIVATGARGSHRAVHECSAEISGAGQVEKSVGTRVGRVEATPAGLKFEVTDALLPLPQPSTLGAPSGHGIVVKNLPEGQYAIKIDGRQATRAEVDGPGQEVPFIQTPGHEQVERLRQAINEKNRLYFYRWRPQNETYLFGFRSKEQGNNAREIPLFDPLVEAKEKEIAALRKPKPHVYELIRDGGAGR